MNADDLLNQRDQALELHKWKSLSESYAAEVACLRQAIQVIEKSEGRYAEIIFGVEYFNEANRIKAEREAEIVKDAAEKSLD